MRFLHNKPIQTKVTLVVLLTCSAALLLMGGALLGFQLLTFRQKFHDDLSSLAKTVNKYAAFSAKFDNADKAAEMLAGLKEKLVSAAILSTNGTVFANYGLPVASPGGSVTNLTRGTAFSGRYATSVEPLFDSLENSQIGWLYLRADYHREFWALVKVYVGVVSLVLCVSVFLTLLLSARLQRVISLPILSLAKTARIVADNKDYSVRAQKLEEDEIGLLTEAFNQMLSQIQTQDAELRKSRKKIETLINSIEGVVWEADPETLEFKFVSKQVQRLFAYPSEQWVQEPQFWQKHVHPEDREKTLAVICEAISVKKPFTIEYRMMAADSSVIWVRNYASVVLENDKPSLVRGVLLDISREKAAAEELKALQSELLQTSRQAGMAEVATGVLHNVGNVLNSVNVSTALVSERVRKSQVASLSKVAALLNEHAQDLPVFIAEHPKGKKLPRFIISLAEHMVREQVETIKELDLLSGNIEHIKDIVAMQQSYARVAGIIEILSPETLIEDALRLHSISDRGAEVQITKEYETVPNVATDKHKVLQILVNLFSNAKHAMHEAAQPQKRLVIKLGRHHEHVRISVSDNGVGIPPENLTRIFSHGFTTKKQGHGFGLHSGALAAREMGGSLIGQSDGVGQGAIFILDLPCAQINLKK